MPDMSNLKRYVELTARKKDLTSDLDAVKAELATLEEGLLPQLEAEGVQSVNVDGMLVYRHTQIWSARCDGVDTDLLIGSLAANPDTGFLVEPKVNHNKLSGWLREQDPDPETLLPTVPKHLRGVIEPVEKLALRCRKAAK